MDVAWVWLPLFLTALVVAAVVWRRAAAKREAMLLVVRVAPQPSAPIPIEVLASAPAPILPDCILVGESPERPLIKIEAVSTPEGYENAPSLDMRSSVIDRLSGLLQAVPNLLIADQASGKHLMEVVINGQLTAAADGHGLRAFAMNGKQITEHARLFEPGKFQSLINAAAVWQVASVIVAQKHLADISQKLEEINASLKGISKFLNNQRKARIQSTYDYLAQIAETIRAGELPPSVRVALENCERDLLEIHLHLVSEFRQLVEEKVKHSEIVGTEDLTNGIKTKIEKLDQIAGDLQMCLHTRVGAWHVLSAYPGEAHLISARRASIQDSCDEMQRLAPYLDGALGAEIEAVNARLNRKSTLEERRAMLRKLKVETKERVSNKAGQVALSLRQTTQQLSLQNQPTRLILEVDGGVIVGARQAVANRA